MCMIELFIWKISLLWRDVVKDFLWFCESIVVFCDGVIWFWGLSGEVKMYYIVILNDVVFVFKLEFVCIFCVCFVIVGEIIIYGNGFCLDEVMFEICVDYFGSLWGFGVMCDGLCMGFFWVSGKVGN